jgi:hypothetical protein
VHAIKQINFLRDHPGGNFPVYEPVPPDTALSLRGQIGARLGLDAKDDSVVFAHTLSTRATAIAGVGARADDKSFDLLEVFGRLGIAPLDHVYVNWRVFRDVDRLATHDFAKFFSYLWYPGPDAIDIVDQSCEWVVSVDPDGNVGYVRF